MTDDEIIDTILKYEGGFTNHPNDHGGPTNFGITAADYGRWMRKSGHATVDEVRTMPESTARNIYKKWYIEDAGFDRLTNDKLRLVLVDSGVLFGISRATKWLQQEIGVLPVDGKFREDTATALAKYSHPDLLPRRVLGRRLGAIADIVKRDPSQMVFLRGWISRAASLLDYL
jgi:lysozyme family protein